MNIVYLSHLNEIMSQGPNYSVPAQVLAQKKYDNIFWWNLTEASQPWWQETGVFHSIKEYPQKKISVLPSPFNSPDLVIIEGFYKGDEFIFANECNRRGIPYVLVPRSALTKWGQSQKRIKKLIANIVFYNRMCKRAAGIHYLTEDEKRESGSKWNSNSFVIPNGTYEASEIRKNFNTNKLKGLYIGRFDPFQKGLDLLLEACKKSSEQLRNSNVTFDLYGPERFGCREDYQKMINDSNLQDILSVKEGVFGEEKKKIYLEYDFFIMTSRFEGLPMSLVEAMSYGLPCFVTKGTNMADIITEKNAGWTCDTNVDSICNAFTNLIKSMNHIDQLGNNALEFRTIIIGIL